MKFIFKNQCKIIFCVIVLSCVDGKIRNKHKHQSSREKIQDKESIMVNKKKVDVTTIIDEPFKLEKTIEEINMAHGRFSDVISLPENRRSYTGFEYLWIDTNGRPRVPFVINIGSNNTRNNYTTIIRQSVRAMNKYMSPCGHDVWVEKEDSDRSGYVEFITTLNDGCYSYIGKQPLEKQIIAIGNICATKGIILHEMLHAMGFMHEQQRCDRDSYIEVINRNIKLESKVINVMDQFDSSYCIERTRYFTSYDIFSIMHYDLWAFSNKLKRTANTKTIKLKPEFMNLTADIEEIIGKTYRMSDTDKLKLNIRYGCIAPTCIVFCNGTNTCAELPPTPNIKMLAQGKAEKNSNIKPEKESGDGQQCVSNKCSRIIKSSTSLIGGKLVASIKELDKEFRICFKIYPMIYIEKLHNIIHLAVGSSKKSRGREILGVWFSDAGDGRLNISIPNKTRYFISDPQLLDAHCTIDILQQKNESKYVYTIKINAETVYSDENKKPEIFKNVQVYASNPWDLVQISNIEEMFIINGKKDLPSMIDLAINPSDSVVQLSEKEICENEVIATISNLKEVFSISFKLKSISYSKEWQNVLHITKGQNFGECGDRYPAVFFDGSGRLEFFSDINGKINSKFVTKNPLPLNVWSSIKIEQTFKNGGYVYAIFINGSIQYETENKDPRQFKDMKVFISDPWYTAHDGWIKELFVVNGDTKISNATQPRDRFEDASKQKLKENNLVATMSHLSSEFTVLFQIKPTSYSKGFNSVFYFLLDRDSIPQANHQMAAWFDQDGSGRLSFFLTLLNVTTFTTNDSLPLNNWSSIKLTRTKNSSENQTNFNIYLNEKLVFNDKAGPKTFEFVRVFFGNPWQSVQKGWIKDLKIYNN